MVDRRLPGGQFVGADEVEVGYQATRHLIAQGYRRIAHLHGPNVSTANDRYDGYRKALREARLKVPQSYIAEVLYHQEASFVIRWLQRETSSNEFGVIGPRPISTQKRPATHGGEAGVGVHVHVLVQQNWGPRVSEGPAKLDAAPSK